MDKKIKDRASAIIPYGEGLITIHRIKGVGDKIKNYYTIPGGGREEGESIEEAVLREIQEELGIKIKLTDICYKLVASSRTQYFFVAKYMEGELGSGKGDEMINTDYDKHGSYTVEIIPKEEIINKNLLPAEIKEIILRDFDKIFHS